MKIVGISAYYHDSAAALVVDGEIVAAGQEERFTRKKHDASFPQEALTYCLKEAGLKLADIDQVVFYDKPILKFERLLETYLCYAPKGVRSFVRAMPIWLKEKLFLKDTIRKELSSLSGLKKKDLPQLLFTEHHQSHAASAFFPSPFKEAAVLCLDGVGEWATTSLWHGDGNQLSPVWQIDFPHSLGLLYSAFTYYTGFKVNSGEYKLMGLAPYGEPKYVELIRDNLIDVKEDGTFRLDMGFFDFATGLRMTNRKFAQLFGAPARERESEITQREMDIARSIQVITEEIVLKLSRTAHKETGCQYLCLAGGVALNCVANGRVVREGPFQRIWIQPAAGDAGGALGAALAAHYQFNKADRVADDLQDRMRGSYLGPDFEDEEIESELSKLGAKYTRHEKEDFIQEVASILENKKVVGWFQGRMEFGPRALGGRSIIGDPRCQEMQTTMNLKIKFRESFRPFAPAVLASDVGQYFEHQAESPYMLIVAPIVERKRIPLTADQQKLFGIEKLKCIRSEIPAVTHVDYSARIQTVHDDTNPRFHGLLSEFKKRTGCSVLVNTSFNVRGEPIVCSVEDAYRCFMRTKMDCLAIGNFVLLKGDQPDFAEDGSWQEEFELD